MKLLLDTSALRQLGGDTIAVISNHVPLCVSPLAVWELLSHLDEPGHWNLFRAPLLRCLHCEVLHDPFVELAEWSKLDIHLNTTRRRDRELAVQLVGHLVHCRHVDDLGERSVRLDGAEHRLGNACANARKSLAEEEAKHVDDMRRWMSIIEQELPELTLGNLTAEDVRGFVVAVAQDLVTKRDGSVTGNQQALEVLWSSFYFLTYVLVRALDYMARGALLPDSELQLDGNDLEDSAMLFHLRLDEDAIVVTDDRTTLRAVGLASEALRRLALKQGHDFRSGVCALLPVELRVAFREQLISHRAYRLWERRGRPDGDAQVDWFEAARLLKL